MIKDLVCPLNGISVSLSEALELLYLLFQQSEIILTSKQGKIKYTLLQM